MQQTIKHRIEQKTCGRIQMLEVEVNGDAVVIRGSAPCYYVKQLALLGAREVLGAQTSKRIELNVVVAAGPTNCETEAF